MSEALLFDSALGLGVKVLDAKNTLADFVELFQDNSSRGLDKTHVGRYRSLDAWVVAKAVDEQTSA